MDTIALLDVDLPAVGFVDNIDLPENEAIIVLGAVDRDDENLNVLFLHVTKAKTVTPITAATAHMLRTSSVENP
jgi:hypothetical protein